MAAAVCVPAERVPFVASIEEISPSLIVNRIDGTDLPSRAFDGCVSKSSPAILTRLTSTPGNILHGCNEPETSISETAD